MVDPICKIDAILNFIREYTKTKFALLIHRQVTLPGHLSAGCVLNLSASIISGGLWFFAGCIYRSDIFLHHQSCCHNNKNDFSEPVLSLPGYKFKNIFKEQCCYTV